MILYLDIDGVLATGRRLTLTHKGAWPLTCNEQGKEVIALDPQAARLLQDVLREFPQVRVVLNSTWRRHPEHLPRWLRTRLHRLTPAHTCEGVQQDQAQHGPEDFICLDA